MLVNLSGEKMDDGQTFTTDHVVQGFKVVIRSTNGISEEILKAFIQKMYEVVSVKKEDEITYVKTSSD